jgi:hypothetical protein
MIVDLITYLVKVKSLIPKQGAEYKFLLQEITRIAVDNWVSCAIPDLTKEQLDKVIVTCLAKKEINLN